MIDDIELKTCNEFARGTIAAVKAKGLDRGMAATCLIREALAMHFNIDPHGDNANNLVLHVVAYGRELLSQATIACVESVQDREWLKEHYARTKAQSPVVQLQEALIKRAQKTVLESGKLQANKVKETLP